jgi:hypothetical protein
MAKSTTLVQEVFTGSRSLKLLILLNMLVSWLVTVTRKPRPELGCRVKKGGGRVTVMKEFFGHFSFC